jgi:RNA polymerase sigma-32 factor
MAWLPSCVHLPNSQSLLMRASNMEGAVMAQASALPILSGETGLSRYLEEIRRFPLLEPQEEFMLAKCWREHHDDNSAHKLVTSHLRLVAKTAMGYRGYGLPISEVISEGNVGLMQAVKRFEPERGFRLATYAMWWIKAAIQEYILRSWSLVKIGTTTNQKKLFFNLRKAKSRISALEEGDLHPDHVKLIATRLGVTEQDVTDMNRRLGGDASLNTPVRDDGDSGEWMDWLVDEGGSQESRLVESEQSEKRHRALGDALTTLNDRERRIFEARRLADHPTTLEDLANEFSVSRERVRQIEMRAFEKVQKTVRNRIVVAEEVDALAGSGKREKMSAVSHRPFNKRVCKSNAGVRPSPAFSRSHVSSSHVSALPISPTDGKCHVAGA